MAAALLGRKVGMTRLPNERGEMDPVTVVKAGPCVVLQVKTPEHDGYHAVQLGFEDRKPHRSTMAIIGQCGKVGSGPKRFIREVRLADSSAFSPGEVVTVEQFAEGKVAYVDVIGVTKGKGFAGVMKRHGFGGQPGSHGTERKHRSPGSIGGMARRGWGRSVKKGKKMPGHMGSNRRTVSSLAVLGTDSANDLLLIRGSVPGANGALVVIKPAKKKG